MTLPHVRGLFICILNIYLHGESETRAATESISSTSHFHFLLLLSLDIFFVSCPNCFCCAQLVLISLPILFQPCVPPQQMLHYLFIYFQEIWVLNYLRAKRSLKKCRDGYQPQRKNLFLSPTSLQHAVFTTLSICCQTHKADWSSSSWLVDACSLSTSCLSQCNLRAEPRAAPFFRGHNEDFRISGAFGSIRSELEGIHSKTNWMVKTEQASLHWLPH